MIRLVLAVVLATALVGATLPALEDARATNSERAVRSDLVRVERAVAELRAENAVAPGEPGARRVLSVTLPSESQTSARVPYVEFGSGSRGTGVLAYALAGGARREIRLSTDLRTDTGDAGDGDPLVLRRAGTYRVALEPVRIGGERSILVRLVDAHI